MNPARKKILGLTGLVLLLTCVIAASLFRARLTDLGDLGLATGIPFPSPAKLVFRSTAESLTSGITQALVQLSAQDAEQLLTQPPLSTALVQSDKD
jgi:hypothetical protein